MATRFLSVDLTIALVLSAFALALAGSASAQALPPTTSDARAIARAVAERPTGDHATAMVTLSVHDSLGRERTRTLSQRWLEFDGGTKTIIVFQAPSDVKSTGLLSIDYKAGARDDDQWLFLPSLRKATRISAANAADSFLGTDLTFADITKIDIENYDYTLLELNVTVDGADCWLIEARARTEKERKRTGYLKSHIWIGKANLMPMQSKIWVSDGQKLKYIRATQIVQISGIWVAKMVTVKVVRSGAVESWTTMEMKDVQYGVPSVSDGVFTVGQLEAAR